MVASRRSPVFAKAAQAESAWMMLEELYLEEADAKAKTRYRGWSEDENRVVLKEFAKERSLKSKRWAEIAGGLQPL